MLRHSLRAHVDRKKIASMIGFGGGGGFGLECCGVPVFQLKKSQNWQECLESRLNLKWKIITFKKAKIIHKWIWMIWYVELSSANLDYEEIDSSSSPIATSESWSCFNTLMFHGHFHGKIEWESFPVDSPAINCHAVTEPKTNIFRPKSRPPHATGEHQVLSKLFHQIPQDYIYRATPNSMEQCNSWNEKKWRKHHPKSFFDLLPCPAGTSAS